MRAELGRTGLIALFGITYLVSQVTILILVKPLGGQLAELQLFGFSAERYLAIFHAWEAAGVMPAYRAHFVLDDVHWIWYAGFFTTLLCRLFERARIPHRLDWVLLLPLVSGLADWYENGLQHVFLDAPDFSTLADPLPLLSTLASLLKWTLALIYVSLTGALLLRGRSTRGVEP